MILRASCRPQRISAEIEHWLPHRRCNSNVAATPTRKAPSPAADASSPKAGTLDEIPPLSRPLGVRERPSIISQSLDDRFKKFVHADTLMQERRHLVKEASKGYFHDLYGTFKHSGKTWIAPKVMIKEEKALYLPDISGKCLSTGERKHTTTMCFGKISILCMLGTKISEIHTRGFTQGAHSRYSAHPLYQYIQINLQENLLKSILVKMFSNSLRSVVPPELHPTYLVSSQNMEYLRDPMGCTNSKIGYVYLVDENLRIRWAGCADATPEEAKSLEVCTGVLLSRLEKKPKGERSQMVTANLGV